MRRNIAVIIPTYNARNTIIPLIEKILWKIPNSFIIIVDDSSPDKTGQLVRKHFLKNKRVRLIVRMSKSGRGSAVLQGFQEALRNRSIRYCIEMDADLCHDPSFISALVDATDTADVVVGSRYLPESKNINWKVHRRIFSSFVSTLLRLTLRVPIRDYTNGFRCYTRKALESIDMKTIQSKGFIVLSELAYALYKKGNHFAEVAITFTLLELNPSNLKLSEIKEAISTLFRLLVRGK